MKRRIAVDDVHQIDADDGDVESPSPSRSVLVVSPSSPSEPYHRASPSRSPSSPRSAQHSPRIANDRGMNHGHSSPLLIRKLASLTTVTAAAASSPSSNTTQCLQSFIKDVILGTLLGVMFLLSLLFLDYHHIINIGSSQSFQDAALAYVTHPDTIQSMEENFDVKFVPVVMYTNIIDEISKNTAKISNSTTLAQVEEDLSIRRKEMESIKVEHDQLVAKINEVLKLDNWCGSCKGPWGRCRDRVDYLIVKYGQTEWKSQGDLMSQGHCKNDPNL